MLGLYKENRELLTCTTWTYLKSFVDEHYIGEKDELWVKHGDDYVQYSELEKRFEVQPYYKTQMAANDRFR